MGFLGTSIGDSTFDETNGVPSQLGSTGTTLEGAGKMPVQTERAGGIGESGGIGYGKNSQGGLSMGDYANLISSSQGRSQATGQQQGQLGSNLIQQSEGYGAADQLAAQRYGEALKQGQQAEMATAASARGVDSALAFRTAQEGQAEQAQGAAAGAAEQRLQSQLGASQTAGNVLSQERAGDAALSGQGIGAENAQNQQLLASNEWSQGLNQNIAAQNQATAQNAQSLDQATQSGNAANSANSINAVGPAIVSGGATLAASALNATPKSAHGTIVSGGGPLQPYLLSAGEKVVSPHGSVKIVGGHAPYAGDNPRNDTHPALLHEGDVVVPRTIAGDDASTHAFVSMLRRDGNADERPRAAQSPSADELLHALKLTHARMAGLEARINEMTPKKGRGAKKMSGGGSASIYFTPPTTASGSPDYGAIADLHGGIY